jgi:hypothetical protein
MSGKELWGLHCEVASYILPIISVWVAMHSSVQLFPLVAGFGVQPQNCYVVTLWLLPADIWAPQLLLRLQVSLAVR